MFVLLAPLAVTLLVVKTTSPVTILPVDLNITAELSVLGCGD
jgi:hypothetical protein